MDPNLLNILQKKPVVGEKEGVKIKIGGPLVEGKGKEEVVTKVVDRRADTFFNREELTKRLQEAKKSKVITKMEREVKPISTVKPIVEEKKVSVSKKLPTNILLEEGEEEVIVPAKPKFTLIEEGESPPLLGEVEVPAESILEPTMPVASVSKAITNVKKTYPKKDTYIDLGPIDMVQIGDTILKDRLPPPAEKVDIKVSSYFMNNREYFINFINSLFEPYRKLIMDDSKNITCDNIGQDTGEVSLLTHQRIVRDYINLYTPYRGLLLYHGLGSGKTCSSIAIAEGLKSSRQVIVMTPASLRRNYLEEIKKCGDLIYRKNQFWEFIPTGGDKAKEQLLAKALGFVDKTGKEDTTFIHRQGGAWLVNITKPSNFDRLESEEKKSLDKQLDAMIERKYKFINYNGLRRDRFRDMTNNYETNLFDDAVVIIDEAHNLVSRIVNKINKMSKKEKRKIK